VLDQANSFFSASQMHELCWVVHQSGRVTLVKLRPGACWLRLLIRVEGNDEDSDG
jgi:hypothetical protein